MRRLRLAVLCAALLAGCGPALVWEGRTPSRRAWVRVVEDRAGQRVVVGDRAEPWYGGIGIDELAFSGDGQHLAYPARAGEQWTVVLDGRERGRWSGVGELRFAPQGDRLLFSAERDGRWRVVDGDEPGPPLDAIYAGSLQWSNNGAAFAYAGTRGGLAHVVWNQRLGPAFDGVGRLILGARGERLVYAGRRGDDWHLVDGESVGPPYPGLVDWVLSPDERHLAYVWRDRAQEGLVVDGEALAPLDSGHVSMLSIDDGGQLTFVAGRPDAACVVRHGVAQPLADQIDKLVVTARRYAYVARRQQRLHVVIDGTIVATADAVEDLAASPDGSRFVCMLRRGQRWLVGCDGREQGFDRVIAGSLVWSRDGRHWGVIAGEARSRQIFVFVDGAARRPFDMRELVLLAEKRPNAAPEEAARALRALVAAEVELATR